MKRVTFTGPSLANLQALPMQGRHWAAYEIYRMQRGLQPVARATKPFGDSLCRRLEKTDSGSRFWIYYEAGSVRGDPWIFGLFGCFCNSALDRDCIGTDASAENIVLTEETCTNIWDAVESSPRMAAELQERADLCIALMDRLQSNGGDKELAMQWGVSQRFLRSLRRANISALSLQRLRHAAEQAGV